MQDAKIEELEARLSKLEMQLLGAEIELRITRVFMFVVFRYLGFFQNGLAVLDQIKRDHEGSMSDTEKQILDDRISRWTAPMSEK